jgi:two-component system chemotaxis response regulator CheB
VLKPTSAAEVIVFHEELAEKVKWAARSKRQTRRVEPESAPLRAPSFPEGALVALGASTGGTEALQQIFRALPAEMPPIVIVQHIPAYFSTAFAATLDKISALTVTEAADGDLLVAGHAYVAPGGRQLRIQTKNDRRRLRVTDEARHNHHAPSVDLMFDSLVASVSPTTPVVAGLLTGMGADGAEGLQALRRVGARTFAQDQASSVVWGMPQAAIKLEAAEEVVGIRDAAACVLRLLAAKRPHAR